MNNMSELQEATKEFLIESHENLDQLDTDLVGLEKSPAPTEALGRIFRTLHTIKGSCSFLGFHRLEAVAHAGEALLGKLRDGQVTLRTATTDALLRMVDAIRRMLASVEEIGTDGNVDEPELISLLNRLSADADLPHTISARPSQIGILADANAQEFSFADGLTLGPPQSDDISPEPDAGLTTAESAVYDASVRIPVDLLDKLMTVAGEIVLARNQILQYSQQSGDPSFQNTCRQLNLITTELQEHVMKTRLQPLATIWNRFPRLVRDAAQACRKKVRLETDGSETELDKTLNEAIRDPLTHLVRNAIDHGIEMPEGRRAAGKPEEGCVRLRAYHEGGQVNVEISDDGAGIDPNRVKNRAVEQHLITADQASRMGSQTLLGLIFLPGFSTAPAVTTLSGRGVGMDVVKTNIERIGGSVDVQSTLGQGTTVRIRIPLTLAIIKVLVVTSAGDRYAIPQVSIVELVRVEGEKARKSIHRVHGVQVFRYRDRLLPLVTLNQALKVEGTAPTDEAVNIVVLQAADRNFGLIVDQINDSQEIVVKPLWKHLKSLACFAGATVMGDGRVALILDVFGLAQRAGAISDVHGWALSDAPESLPAAAELPNVLLVEGNHRGRMAIPLEKVARLEEFARFRIEQVASQDVVQYGGTILPLLEIDTILGGPGRDRDEESPASGDPLQVVVYNRRERPVGLIVNRIVDIAAHEGDVCGPASRAGVTHTTVIQGQVTEMLDLDTVLCTAGEA